ncbi:MAG: 16S rRNA (cytidine(1402)-2'-O)-methyltransferase [Trueperaceae bacterium]|nr:MAG: 16S rRNA (cytidine(1402)-2'-O)-methyltransferase [Trueperaceae bacterium]
MSDAGDLAGHRISLVPTPIGHLQDVTLRALDTLRAADVVAAEDTRRSRVLLDRHGITTRLTRLDAHTMAARAPALLQQHRHVAFITDAGTPGISDPGAELVALARDLGVEVEVLPGPTAFVPALVLSGLPAARFTFEGFLPRKGRERRERIAAIAARDHPSIVYEAPTRLLASLRDMAAACGEERSAAVARELTKLHEETRRGTLRELAAHFEATKVRGEIVLVIGPADAERAGVDAPPLDAEALAERLASEGRWGRDLRADLIAAGVPRDVAYALAMRLKQGGER